MIAEVPKFSGLVPEKIKVRSARIILEALEVTIDIGFHDFEIGAPQRLLVTIECWLEDASAPPADDPQFAWNYDFLRSQVQDIVSQGRFNLQETLAHAIFERLSPLHGLRALRVQTSKPDIYPDAKGVGVEIASFSEAWPPL